MTKATAAAIAFSAVAGAGVGAGTQEVLQVVPQELALTLRIVMATAGSFTAAVLFPPLGSMGRLARVWTGAFVGFIFAPYVPNLPGFAWLVGQGFEPISARSGLAGLFGVLILETIARVVGTTDFAFGLRRALIRWLGGAEK